MSPTSNLQKTALDPQAMKMLQGYLKPMAYGAGAGALALGGAEALRPENDDPDSPEPDSRMSRILKSMALGGALGGGMGGGFHAAGGEGMVDSAMGRAPSPAPTPQPGVIGGLFRGATASPGTVATGVGGYTWLNQARKASAAAKAAKESLSKIEGPLASRDPMLSGSYQHMLSQPPIGGTAPSTSDITKDFTKVQDNFSKAQAHVKAQIPNANTQRLSPQGYADWMGLKDTLVGGKQGVKYDPHGPTTEAGWTPGPANDIAGLGKAYGSTRNLLAMRELLGPAANSLSPKQRITAGVRSNITDPLNAVRKLMFSKGNHYNVKTLNPLQADIRRDTIYGGLSTKWMTDNPITRTASSWFPKTTGKISDLANKKWGRSGAEGLSLNRLLQGPRALLENQSGASFDGRYLPNSTYMNDLSVKGLNKRPFLYGKGGMLRPGRNAALAYGADWTANKYLTSHDANKMFPHNVPATPEAKALAAQEDYWHQPQQH
jgi:hypothetical protein